MRRQTVTAFDVDNEWEEEIATPKKTPSKKSRGAKEITNISPGRPKQEKVDIKADGAKEIAEMIKKSMVISLGTNSTKRENLRKKCLLYYVDMANDFLETSTFANLLSAQFGLIVAVCQTSTEVYNTFKWIERTNGEYVLLQKYACVLKPKCYTR